MTPSQLRTEVESGPLAEALAPLVAAGDDAGVAALLNARAYRGPVPINELSAKCLQLGLTGGVLALLEVPLGSEIAPGVPMSLQVKGLLHQMLTLIQTDYRLETADVDDPKFGPGCDSLISLGVIDEAGKAALLALGANRRSRAEVLWGVAVSASGVAAAYGRV